MYIEKQLTQAISHAFQEALQQHVPLSSIKLNLTPPHFQGHYTLVTFPYATPQYNPPAMAQLLGRYLQKQTDLIAAYEVKGPYLNLSLSHHLWVAAYRHITQLGHLSISSSTSKTITIEYPSPNTNKPLHLGHLRNIALGNAMSNIFTAIGYKVNKVNLVNDRGIHICKSMIAYQRFGKGETPAITGEKGDHFVGRYYVRFEKAYQAECQTLPQPTPQQSKPVPQILQDTQSMLHQWEAQDPYVRALWKKMNQWVYDGFAQTFRLLRTTIDHTYYESKTYKLGKNIVKKGLAANVFYQKQDQSVWVDLTTQGLGHKLLLRKDGTSVYITQDLGTAQLRYKDYPSDLYIYVVGNEQNYHFKVLKWVLKKLQNPYADRLYHLSYGMVNLPDGKMKSREGTVVDADNLIAEMVQTAAAHTQKSTKASRLSAAQQHALHHTIALGALNYYLLKVDPQKTICFDPQTSIDFKGNTGPFIQYSHARICAILRKTKMPSTPVIPDIFEPVAQQLIQHLCLFPLKLKEAATTYAPHLLAQYAYDLAKHYNKFYETLPILGHPHRITLSNCVAQTLKQTLQLLHISAPTIM